MLDRQMVLSDVMTAVQKKWGTELLKRGSDYALLSPLPPLPTRLDTLDAVLEGGLPRGEISEFWGTGTAGTTSISMSAIGSAQCLGEKAVYVDHNQTFFPRYAQDRGVQLDDLVVVRPKNYAIGLDIAAEVINRWSVGILVFGHTPSTRDQGTELGMRRLVSAVRRSNAAFIFLNRASAPTTSPLHMHAATRLRMNRTEWLERWGGVGGYMVRVLVLKHHGRESDRFARVRIDLP